VPFERSKRRDLEDPNVQGILKSGERSRWATRRHSGSGDIAGMMGNATSRPDSSLSLPILLEADYIPVDRFPLSDSGWCNQTRTPPSERQRVPILGCSSLVRTPLDSLANPF
jgi:hypothetical protein